MRYLFQKAEAKNQYFDEGTYLIEDPDELFFRFLAGLKGTYERISSHSIGNNISPHYGFDVAEGLMKPTNKRHILFFSTEHNGAKKLFLKPENYGTRELKDLLPHAGEYIESVFVRTGLVTHDADAKQKHRKERAGSLPEDIKALLGKCVSLIEKGGGRMAAGDFEVVTDSQKMRKGLRKDGISCIAEVLNSEDEDITICEELSEVLRELREKMEEIGLDHPETRVGQEVIFTQAELMVSAEEPTNSTPEALGGKNHQEPTGTQSGNRSWFRDTLRRWINSPWLPRNGGVRSSKRAEELLKEDKEGEYNAQQEEDRTSTTDTAESSLPGEGESILHSEAEDEWNSVRVKHPDEEGQKSGSIIKVDSDSRAPLRNRISKFCKKHSKLLLEKIEGS